MNIHTHVEIQVCVHVQIPINIYIYLYLYLYIYIYLYLYIYINRFITIQNISILDISNINIKICIYIYIYVQMLFEHVKTSISKYVNRHTYLYISKGNIEIDRSIFFNNDILYFILYIQKNQCYRCKYLMLYIDTLFQIVDIQYYIL